MCRFLYIVPVFLITKDVSLFHCQVLGSQILFCKLLSFLKEDIKTFIIEVI